MFIFFLSIFELEMEPELFEKNHDIRISAPPKEVTKKNDFAEFFLGIL